MGEDLALRNRAAGTRGIYLRQAGLYLEGLGCPPEESGEEDIRRFILSLKAGGAAPATVNGYLSGLCQ